MERVIGLEQARRMLGRLIREVVENREAVVIARKAREKAILLSWEEYARLRSAEAAQAERRFQEALARIHSDVAAEGLPRSVVEEALREVRRP